MTTEHREKVQALLRDSLILINNNQGNMNLQKIIPQLKEKQSKINELVDPNSIILYNIINNMSI